MLKNCELVEFKEITDNRGALVAIEHPKNLNFDIKRIYYIYDVKKNVERGFHSHNDLDQILIAVNGSVKIRVSTPYKEEIITLDKPNKGLYIGPMIWREMFDFSEGAVLLVLANHIYDESDYIRDKDEYIKKAKKYFEELKSKNIKAKLVKEEDSEFILKLRNDENLGKYLSKTDVSLEKQKEWLRNYKEKEKNNNEFYFKAEDKNGDVGFFRLYNIDKEKKELTFGSFIMKNDRPKYAAIESMILAMEFSFNVLEVSKVLLDVRIKNERAKHFYQRFGFKKTHETELDEFYELTKEDYLKMYEEKYKEFI